MTHYLSVEEILRIHFQVIGDYGGSHGVRVELAILAAASAPRQAVFGEEQYKTNYEKAAVYLRNIIGDHPFFDGNKRTAVTTCAVFLARNGIKLTAKPKELEDFAVKIATGKLHVEQIATWLRGHSSKG